jgi:hypothetical protein
MDPRSRAANAWRDAASPPTTRTDVAFPSR